MFTYVTFHLTAPPLSISPQRRSAGCSWSTWSARSSRRWRAAGSMAAVIAPRWRLGMAGGGLGALLTLTPSLPSIVIGLALIATGVFIAQATASSYIGTVTSEDRGLAVGLYSTCYYAGGSVGGRSAGLGGAAGRRASLSSSPWNCDAGDAWRYWTPASRCCVMLRCQIATTSGGSAVDVVCEGATAARRPRRRSSSPSITSTSSRRRVTVSSFVAVVGEGSDARCRARRSGCA